MLLSVGQVIQRASESWCIHFITLVENLRYDKGIESMNIRGIFKIKAFQII